MAIADLIYACATTRHLRECDLKTDRTLQAHSKLAPMHAADLGEGDALEIDTLQFEITDSLLARHDALIALPLTLARDDGILDGESEEHDAGRADRSNKKSSRLVPAGFFMCFLDVLAKLIRLL